MLRRFIPQSWIERYRILRARYAAWKFGYPSRELIVIGVTGTDGKTTTSSLITQLLESSGKRVGMLSTVFFRIGGKERVNETKLTSLSSLAVQRALRAMVDAGDQYAVVETSSHALDQHRMLGVEYDIAVITNTSHEHLDYHKTMEGYRAAKGKLFASLATAYQKSGVKKAMVLNMDDPTFDNYVQFPADVKIGYSTRSSQSSLTHLLTYSLTADHIVLDGWSSRFNLRLPSPLLRGEGEVVTIQLPLPGTWNISNALAAVSVASILGVNTFAIKNALANVKSVPGRMERIDEGQPFTVLIDYAVTPNAFEHLYKFLHIARSQKPEAKIYAVFGATGERDREKRPILGRIAAEHADVVILTNEDPWREDPHAIIDAVAKGAVEGGKKEGENFFKIFDRGEAIRYAVEHAKPGDIVVITGKGAETSMAIGKQKIPWDERAIVRQIVRQYAKP
ncbi:UDP-N-acetylmuramoyl-L-alanyl-D-glutamate--2,6-diaminopimelate ligase [Candidatus Uhrbacteria bacterium]|nr:UDP-N-acetylmuramoyl-L-alanyl-D-glutamate--2,6-diaminopimelate ligase [Candidatus Uhrbacteria bacterium]